MRTALVQELISESITKGTILQGLMLHTLHGKVHKLVFRVPKNEFRIFVPYGVFSSQLALEPIHVFRFGKYLIGFVLRYIPWIRKRRLGTQ